MLLFSRGARALALSWLGVLHLRGAHLPAPLARLFARGYLPRAPRLRLFIARGVPSRSPAEGSNQTRWCSVPTSGVCWKILCWHMLNTDKSPSFAASCRLVMAGRAPREVGRRPRGMPTGVLMRRPVASVFARYREGGTPSKTEPSASPHIAPRAAMIAKPSVSAVCDRNQARKMD